jgi:hypothetical protein
MIVAVLAFLLIPTTFCLQSPAEAGTIDPGSSSAVWLNLIDGTARVCPAGDGGSSILVTVNQTGGVPLEGALVTLTFSSTCDVFDWGPHEGYTSSSGTIEFHPRVGLLTDASTCCYVTATVTAVYEGEPSETIPWGGNPSDFRAWRGDRSIWTVTGLPTEP